MADRKTPRRPTPEELDLFKRTIGEAGADHEKPKSIPETAPAPAAGMPKSPRRRGGGTRGGGPAVDARLDLHGMTLDAAHKSLDEFIDRARGAGQTRLLVITGKGGRGRGPDETHIESRARLSVKVPLWLERRAGVAAVERAHPRQGGEGALYVILKRSS